MEEQNEAPEPGGEEDAELSPEELALQKARGEVIEQIENVKHTLDGQGRIITDFEKARLLMRLLARVEAEIDAADTGAVGSNINPTLLERARLIRGAIVEVRRGPKPLGGRQTHTGIAKVQPLATEQPPPPEGKTPTPPAAPEGPAPK